MQRSTKITLLGIGLGLVCFRLSLDIIIIVINDKQTLTLAEYAAKEPKGDWFEFTDGTLDLTQATYFSFLGTGSAKEKVFIPIFPAGDTAMTSPKVLLVSDDSHYINLINRLHENEGDALIARLQHSDKYYIKRPLVKGYRAHLEDGQDRQLRERFPTVRIVLEDQGGPPYDGAIFLGGVACLLLFFLIRNIQADKEEKELLRFFKEQQASQERSGGEQ